MTTNRIAREWQQVSGDMDWSGHGCVLARRAGRYVDLIRIEPWLELNISAIETHVLWCVDSMSIDLDDMDADSVKRAASYAGVDKSELASMDPVYIAEMIAQYSGYDDSRSVNRIADALPKPLDQIAFWSGETLTEAKCKEIDATERLTALQSLYKTNMTYGVVPPIEAIELAMGYDPYTMDLQGQDALAYDYAMTAFGRGDLASPLDAESLRISITALCEALPPSQLSPEARAATVDIVGRWESRYGAAESDPESDEPVGIAQAAYDVASSIMETLGFEWV